MIIPEDSLIDSLCVVISVVITSDHHYFPLPIIRIINMRARSEWKHTLTWISPLLSRILSLFDSFATSNRVEPIELSHSSISTICSPFLA